MRRANLSFVVLLSVLGLVVACTDRPSPTAPELSRQFGTSLAVGTCTTMSNLTALVTAVFGAGSPNTNSALSKLNLMDKKLQKGDLTGAIDGAKNLIAFLLNKANELVGRDQIPALISSLECYVGITNDAFLVYPLDQPQTIVNAAGTVGVALPSNPVTEPTLITLVVLPDTTTGLLNTKLDKYPGFVRITQQSSVVNSLKDSVVVGVCPAATGILPEVRARLRLGHQKAVGPTGFELTQPGNASFLTCAPSVASAVSKLPGWMQSLASLVVPKPLYAYVLQAAFGGGVGGTVTEFSPFGPVDPVLAFGGGVGGTVTEFIRVPAPTDPTSSPRTRTPQDPTSRTPGVRPPAARTGAARTPATKALPGEMALRLAGGSPALMTLGGTAALVDCTQFTVGTALPAECRPRVTLTTAQGTIMQGVPVSFAIGAGGGTTAIDNPTTRVCSTFGAAASTTTNLNGKAGACLTLGAEAGTNTLVATPSAGGDAPAGVIFSPASNTFTVAALKAPASISLSGLSPTYTGGPLAATATTTPLGLETVSITYDGSPSAPTGAGTYTVVATLDNPSYAGTATGSMVIGRAAQSALVASGPASYAFGAPPYQLSTSGGSGTGAVTFNASASTACAVTSGGQLSITSGTGSCDVTATKAADTNYDAVTSAPISIAPGKAAATIALSDLSYTYDGSGKSATATTTPGSLSVVTITYDGGATLPIGAGSYAVSASLSNADYTAPVANATLTIAPAQQAALVVTGASTMAFGGSAVTLSSTGGSGTGAVTFNAGASTACVVTAGGVVSATTGTGTCVITATNVGDTNYLAVTSAPFGITVTKANQAALSVTGPSGATFGDAAVSLGSSGGSGTGAVTFSATGSAACAVTAAGSLTVTTGTGSCSITATKATDGNYNETTSAPFAITINRAAQLPVLRMTAPLTATYGAGTVQVGTSGGAGIGGVTYDASTSPLACSVDAGTGVVTVLLGTGSCVVSATKAGDADYLPAAAAAASITLNKASQSINFGALGGKTYGDAAFAVAATATSGLPVTFAAGAGSQCTVLGATVTPTTAGSCTVVASQVGNANYFAAAIPVAQGFTIAKRGATATSGSATINFGAAVPSIPCSVTGLLSPDAGSVTCTTSVAAIPVAGTYPTTPVISPANPLNYSMTSVPGVLTVAAYKQVDCFSSPIYSVMPETRSAQRKGSNLPVKCTLTTPQGTPVATAKGNLVVDDRGTDRTLAPFVVNGPIAFQGTNVFGVSTSGNYSYGLNTGTVGFIVGHYYYVTATWNDGSKTVGWFLLK